MFWFLIGFTSRFHSICLSHRLEAAHCGVEDADDEDGDASCVDVDSCHLEVQPLMTCCIIEKVQKNDKLQKALPVPRRVPADR